MSTKLASMASTSNYGRNPWKVDQVHPSDLIVNKFQSWDIIVPTARQERSQGENRNVDRFFMPRDSFTFHGRNKEGQLSNRAEQLSN